MKINARIMRSEEREAHKLSVEADHGEGSCRTQDIPTWIAQRGDLIGLGFTRNEAVEDPKAAIRYARSQPANSPI